MQTGHCADPDVGLAYYDACCLRQNIQQPFELERRGKAIEASPRWMATRYLGAVVGM